MRNLMLALGVFASLQAVAASAEPTTVMTRALAANAKFIGTSMGGVQVTLRDARTGRVLAEGVTSGGTGDTRAIMDAQGRSSLRAGGDAAGYLAVIDITEPMLVELAMEGPLQHPGSMSRATARRWIMPSGHITDGDGWVIEMPGIVVTPASTIDGRLVSLEPKIELLCGCPITPQGPWKAADYEVRASLWQGGIRLGETLLSFTKSPGVFSGSLRAPRDGIYRVAYHARNIRTGNSGVTISDVSIGQGPSTD